MHQFEKRQKKASYDVILDSVKKVQYEFFLKVAGLLSTGVDLKKRFGPKQDRSANKLRRIYCRIICSLFWFYTLRQFGLMFISDRWMQVVLGDITGYWNNYRMYYLMPSFFFSLQTALCCTMFLIKEDDLGWFVPFLSLGQIHLGNTRITMDHTMHNTRINIVIFLVWLLTLGTTAAVSIKTFETAWENFDQATFRLWIPWMVLQNAWFFYFVYISYLVVSYFNLVCLMISKRFNAVCSEIEQLAESDPNPINSKNEQINQTYADHNEACELVDESNTFWRSYIFVTFMTYIPCSCYVLYNLFFADFDTTLTVYTWGTFFHCLIILAIICISAAEVSAGAHAPYTALHTISLFQLPIDLEINMSTFLHRVRGPTIGFSCLDLFVVTNSSISNTLAAVASYFLIVADFSRSTMTNRYRNQNVADNSTTMTTISSLFTTVK